MYCGRAQCTNIAPGVGVGLRSTRRAAARLSMQAQVLVACKVGAAHSLAALARVLVFMASTDTNAYASTRTSASSCSCLVRFVGANVVAAVAIAAVGCVFIKELTTIEQPQQPS